MRDLQAELKELRLHGMAQAWADMLAQESGQALHAARALIERLLDCCLPRSFVIGRGVYAGLVDR